MLINLYEMLYTILINSVAVYLTSKILPGVEVKNFLTAIFVAIGLALVNAFIKPFIVVLTLPVTIITLGLFIWIIDAFMIKIVDALMDDFEVRSFGWAIGFGLVLSIVNALLFWLF
ncbi:MAG: phage holin family protein [Balneolaceae bacterium]|nr:phage holin family protein [Balneolaceae bacterium]